VYPANSKNAEELVKNASQAMFFAKSSGRNRFSHFTFGLQEAAAQRNRLTRDLRRAVDVKQFEVYYQPIVELSTGLVRRAEALVRWNHDGRGQIMPLEFIPLAEDNGAIVDIGDWVFREAAAQVKRLRASVHPDFTISINTSPVQFRSNRSTPADWVAVLDELGLPGSSIVLELTESVLLKAEEFSSHKLKAFREAGFQFAIDDFGTGYSSLAYLKRFDVDYLKIDQSFVRDLETDPSDKVLCEAIIVMAHKLGLKVVAEGVETEAQQAFLADAGCDFAQGFLYAKAVSAGELVQKLEDLR
jgi:EAL domain-containing protein (putative c-di-GMP-specific phosphodiesterase class I)